MKTITFTHANTGKEADIVASQIFAFSYNPKMACMLLYSTGGAVFPVKETREEIKEKLSELKDLSANVGPIPMEDTL